MAIKHFHAFPLLFLALLLVFPPAEVLAEKGEPSAEQAESESTSPPIPEDESLKTKLDASLEEISSLEKKVRETATLYLQSEGEEREQAWADLGKLESAIDKELDSIVRYFDEMKKQGQDISDLKSRVEKVIVGDQKLLSEEMSVNIARLEELAKVRKDADLGEKARMLQSAEESIKHLGVMFNSMLKNVKRKEAIGIDTDKDLEGLDTLLVAWAGKLSARIELINKEREAAELAYSRAAEGDKEAMKSQLDEVRDRHALFASSLETAIEIMKKRGMDTGEYSKLLITSTGKITQGIFEKGVAVSLFSEWLAHVRDWLMENGAALVFQFIVIVLILIAFRFLAMLVSKVITRGLEKSKLEVSHLFREFAISTSRKAVMLFGILVALSQMGIDVGPMLAGLGVAGFVIGFALKDTLSNFASGMMILIYRPFDVGDAVEVDGVLGKVKAMTLVSTTVLTFDNQQLMIPNNNIWGNTIKNITARKIRRVDMTFGIGYSDDIAKAEEILWKIVKEHPLVLESPEPVIKVSALGASSVDFIVRPWSNTADYWDVYWDITRSVKVEFDKAGISIPFPQSDVHLYRHEIDGSEPKELAKE
jgi:small conductance mechanosensitive channel